MRVIKIATAVLVAAVGVVVGTAAWGESFPLRAKELAAQKVKVTADVRYDKMTSMGSLAHIYGNAIKQVPAAGKGQSFRASIRSAPKGDDGCIGGDEDCGGGGYSEGPSGGQAELAIAVDSTGMKIVIGFNDTRGFALNPISVSGFATSSDGGVTFVDGGQLPASSNGHVGTTLLPQVFGDPDVKYIPGGAGCQFVYTSIGVIGLGPAPNFTGTAQTMVIHRSTDCGATWSGPFEIPPATNPTGVITGGNARDAADKEFMDVDPETGRVLLSWSNFTSSSVIPGFVQVSTTFSDNVMTATPPTWSPRVVINPGSGTFDTGSMPRFAGNGSNNAYVTYSTESLVAFANNVKVSRSTDNGVTWSPPIALGPDFFTIDFIIGNDRVHSFPSISVDTSSGPNSGNVYVVAAGDNSGDGADIMYWKSTNGGVSFSPAVFLNARPGADRSQWFPTIAVDKTTGRVNVMYDDQGPATSGDLMEMTWIYSDDGGTTWAKPSPLVARPFHGGYGNDTGQPNLGDYNMLAAQNGTLYATFTATPVVASFVDGEPTSASFPYPSFLPGPNPPGFAKVTAGKIALQLGAVSYTESGGNGLVDAGDQVRYTVPLFNYVTNPVIGPTTYTGVSATLSSLTPGVTVLSGPVTYPNIAPGATQNNSPVFVVQVAPNFTPGTRIEFSLAVTTGQGNRTLLFSQNTGTPVTTTIFAEDFNGASPPALPAGWIASHFGGANTVPWITSSTFCGTASNGLFHANANDGVGGTGNPTRFERAFSPVFSVPASEYVTLDFDICYDTEDDPNFNVLAYDGVALRVTDQTSGHILRSVFLEAFEESFTTGTSNNYPKHAPRSSSSAYFQDISMWAGDSGGFKHVSLRLPGMASTAVQLRWEFTQDSGGTCADVRPGHSCGVIIDNIVMKSVTSKSDELKSLTLRPVPGQVGTYTGTVTSQAIAGAGGIVVNLTSDHPVQTTITPSTVTIPAGSQVSPTFTVTTTVVGTKVIITATGPSNSRTAAILVTP